MNQQIGRERKGGLGEEKELDIGRERVREREREGDIYIYIHNYGVWRKGNRDTADEQLSRQANKKK